MTDNDTVLELYNRGISAHDLRSSYVGNQLGDNPYVRYSRQQIEREKRELQGISSLTGREMDGEFFDLHRALDALEEAESKASEVLSSGEVIGLGLTDAQNLSPKIVPRLEWPFLTIDFEKSSSSGPELDYVGLYFVFRNGLTEEQVQILEATSKSTAVRRTEMIENHSLRDLNISTWEVLRLRFVKDKFVEVGGPEQKIRLSLGVMGLLNGTTGQENKACVVLLQMANGVTVTTNEKHPVSNLRQLLRNQFGLSSDPFHIEEGRGYVPNFELIDGRDAADRRAEDEAVMVSHQEIQEDRKEMVEGLFHSPSTGYDQDEHPYKEDGEMRGDAASAYIQKREMGG